MAMKTRVSPFLVVALVFALAACAGGGPPASDAGGTSPPPAESPSSAPPDEPANGEPGNGGGGVDPNPNPGNAKLVEPVPGQLDIHPVAIDRFDYRVEGRHVVLNAFWFSGVEPCTVLDSVVYEQDGETIEVTVFEGHGPGDEICIEIAIEKVTVVDLGELDPGEYTIRASEGPAVVTITVG
jgi:predicted small lipoprotein YifL